MMLSVSLSVCLSVRQSVSLSVRPSVHLSPGCPLVFPREKHSRDIYSCRGGLLVASVNAPRLFSSASCCSRVVHVTTA